MNFTYEDVKKWMTELGMSKREALTFLNDKLGDFDKELLDHYEIRYSNNIRNNIDLEESKKIYTAIRILCERTEPEKHIITSKEKHLIDCDKTLWGKYL